MKLIPDIKAVRAYADEHKMPFVNALLAGFIQNWFGGLKTFLYLTMVAVALSVLVPALQDYVLPFGVGVVTYLELLYHTDPRNFSEEFDATEMAFCPDKTARGKGDGIVKVMSDAQDWYVKSGGNGVQ